MTESAPRFKLIDAGLWLATVASAGLTFWFSFAAVPFGSGDFPGADKVEHFAGYFVTTLLLFLAAWWRPGRGKGPLYRWKWWLVVLVIAMGGVFEIAQSLLTADRRAELLDWFSEYAAVLAASFIVMQMEARSRTVTQAEVEDETTSPTETHA